ncbi:urease accessory protein UreD [Ruegeria arenilitoris]|uniref:urease accessory protein UreD n=1 Tax=Ruegeria arenilitoris TaxID=1173585 RepID=UPI0014802E3D|nr:urease accessory protein UreD [Ruegeria arenilitoris]
MIKKCASIGLIGEKSAWTIEFQRVSREKSFTGISLEDSVINQFSHIPSEDLSVQPRAEGVVELRIKPLGGRSVIDKFRQVGSFKCLFPRGDRQDLDAVLLNTAGGVTGGDRFRLNVEAKSGTSLTLTTQACERAYKAKPSQTGKVRSQIKVRTGARVNWLPQETLLFNGSALDRRLVIDLEAKSHVLMVEPLVFGRPAMGEILNDIRLRDRIEIWQEKKVAFLDAISFSGNLHEHLDRPNIAQGAGAMALVVFASDMAEGQLSPICDMLPDTGGASLLQKNLLTVRLFAKNGYYLRQSLLPVLRQLNNNTLPRCWML